MAGNKNTSDLTIKHAILRDNPLRVDYEVYRNYRTGKKLHWVVPTTGMPANYFEELFAGKEDILEDLIEGKGVNLAVWTDTFTILGLKVYVWTRVERLAKGISYYTDPIDRARHPKLSEHRNNNEL